MPFSILEQTAIKNQERNVAAERPLVERRPTKAPTSKADEMTDTWLRQNQNNTAIPSYAGFSATNFITAIQKNDTDEAKKLLSDMNKDEKNNVISLIGDPAYENIKEEVLELINNI